MEIIQFPGFEMIIGYVAAVCTTVAFVPQAVRSLRYRDTKSLSLTMYVIFSFGVSCWLIYGLIKMDPALILANSITVALAVLILIIKIRTESIKPLSILRRIRS